MTLCCSVRVPIILGDIAFEKNKWKPITKEKKTNSVDGYGEATIGGKNGMFKGKELNNIQDLYSISGLLNVDEGM